MVDPILMGLALGAGLISFSSPCALPLLPAYAVYFMGVSSLVCWRLSES